MKRWSGSAFASALPRNEGLPRFTGASRQLLTHRDMKVLRVDRRGQGSGDELLSARVIGPGKYKGRESLVAGKF